MADKRLFVSTKDESPKLFENDILDFFTRVPWYVPLFIFIPVIGMNMIAAIWYEANSLLQILGMAVVGLLTWSLFEYFVHRWVFHTHPTNPTLARIHHISHGIHHDFPQDSLRLVMPPAVSIPLALIIFYSSQWVFWHLGAPELQRAFFAWFVLGYLVYDMMHYATHHLHYKAKWFQRIKEHHMKHHYRDPDAGFGFTSKTWDKVFRTDFEEKKPGA